MPSKPQPVPTRPDRDDAEEPVLPEIERIVRERITDPGPLRPWGEFEAEESRRKPESPTPR
jgi:hypothetical protein